MNTQIDDVQTRTINKTSLSDRNLSISKSRKLWGELKKNYELYLFLLPTLLYFLIFHYGPMYGIQLAFKDFIAVKGITGSPWAGLKHFRRLFNSYQFWPLIKNTILLSLYQLTVGFPIPIILALLLNQMMNKNYKKIVQTVTYAPHFISTVVLVGMMHIFLSPRNGLINIIITQLGGEPVFFLGSEKWFRSVYVLSGVWQNSGWSAIIYLAALSGIDPALHEAAIVDGANKHQRVWYIDVPGILPTAIIMLILNLGQLMSVGFEKVFLMQNSLNLGKSEIISTYVYKVGLLGSQYSFATAVGLFNSIVNFILLIVVNKIAKSSSEISLW